MKGPFFPEGDMVLHDIKVRELYEHDRLSCAEIARLGNCSETLIYNKLKLLKVKIRSRSEANKIFPDFIFIILYNIGLSTNQIGRLLGVDASTVTKRLHIMAFPMRVRQVASRIRYTEKEFERYFMVPGVIDQLTELVSI